MRVLIIVVAFLGVLIGLVACSSENETFALKSMQAGDRVEVNYKLDGFEATKYELNFEKNMVSAKNQMLELTDEELTQLDSYLESLNRVHSSPECSSIVEYQLTYFRSKRKVGKRVLNDQSCLTNDDHANFDALVYFFRSDEEVPTWREGGNKSIID